MGKNREIFKRLTKNWQNFVTRLLMDIEGQVIVWSDSMVPGLDICVDVYIVNI